MTSLSSVTIDSTGKLVFSRSLSPFLLAEMTAESKQGGEHYFSNSFEEQKIIHLIEGEGRALRATRKKINRPPCQWIDLRAETRCVIHLFLFGKC